MDPPEKKEELEMSDTANRDARKRSMNEKDPKASNSKQTEATSLIDDPVTTEKRHLCAAALGVSWFSVVFSMSTGIAALVIGINDGSEALFAYGVDAVLDSISSLAVVWRFCGVTVDSVEAKSREKTACMVIGVLFLISSASLIYKALAALIEGDHESKASSKMYEIFALVCASINLLIAAGKIYLGYRLDSPSLCNDSIITISGALVCIAGVVGLKLYMYNPHFWYLDSIFGILTGVFLLIFGIRILYKMTREQCA